MNSKKALWVMVLSSVTGLGVGGFPRQLWAAQAQAQSASGQAAVAKRIGTIKSASGNSITLADAAGEIVVVVQSDARILRLEPGEKDLKSATPVALQELKTGDTIRVRGALSADGKTFNALEVLLITHSAVAAMSDQIRQDWQKRGVGGLVDSVDVATGTVRISIPGLAGKRTITVHCPPGTTFRRYSPGSIKFEDAKASTLQEIQVGDQLRARGDRNADGSELTAQEVVTGKFSQLDATVKSVDPGAGTVTVQDLASKKMLQLHITADSQLHRVPAETAQMFAAIVKRMTAGGAPGSSGNRAASSQAAPGNGPPQGGPPAGGNGPNGGRMGAGMRGQSDFQRGLDQTPTIALADLHKGDAVAILAGEGTSPTDGTVVKLFSGVEPILEAAPSASQAMMLAPWSLGGAPNGDTGTQ